MPDSGSRYLPAHLAKQVDDGALSIPPRVDVGEAAMLLTDVIGFTALTAKLQEAGRTGAEEISDIMTAAFFALHASTHRWGGSIVSVSGDASFALFHGDSAVQRAMRAAEEISEHIEAQEPIETSAGPFELQVTQVVHFGEVHELHVGTMERRHFALSGPGPTALSAMKPSEKRTLVSPEAQARALDEPAPTAAPLPPLSIALDAVRPFFPPVWGDVERFDGRFARCVVAFVETEGWTLDTAQTVFAQITGPVEELGGVLVKTDLSVRGIRWLIAFGLPQSHEDSAERAARALLGLGKALGAVRTRASIRAGIVANVKTGSDVRWTIDVMGDAVNTAARFLEHSEWGQVVMSPKEWDALTEARGNSLGFFQLRGKADAVELFALTELGDRPAPQVRLLCPLVGRSREMGILLQHLDDALEGTDSVVGVVGDPGIGKSRIGWELRKAARMRGFETIVARCTDTPSPSGPVYVDLLRNALGAEAFEELSDLLGMQAAPMPFSDMGTRTRLNVWIAARTHLRKRANQTPLLIVLEDVHWADDATKELISILHAGMSARVMVLLLYRPGFQFAGAELVLTSLDGGAVSTMLRSLLPGPAGEFLEPILERTGGNPFFIEELIRHLLETDADAASLPPNVESLIATRVDALSEPALRIAEIGSVIGRVIPLGLLDAVPSLAVGIDEALEELSQRGILFTEGDRGAYIFKNALTSEAIYARLLTRRKRELHGLVAQAYEAAYAESERPSGVLARHWLQGGDDLRAVEYLIVDAENDFAQLNVERAAATYKRVLGILSQHPDTESPERIAQIQQQLGHAVLVHGDYDAAEAAWDAAAQIHRQEGRLADELLCIHQLALVASQRSRFSEAIHMCAEGLARAGQDADPIQLASFEATAGLAACGAGRFPEAEKWTERALKRLETIPDAPPGLCASIYRTQGNVLIGVGRPRLAAEAYERGLPFAAEAGDHWGHSIALFNLGDARARAGDLGVAMEYFEEALRKKKAIGDRWGLAYTHYGMATVQFDAGRLGEALERVAMALKIANAIGEQKVVAMARSLCGRIYALTGDPRAHEEFQQAREIAERIGAIPQMVEAFVGLSALQLETGQFAAAVDLANRAHTLATESRAAGLMHNALLMRCAAFQARGDMDGAEQDLAEAERVADSLGNQRLRIDVWIAGARLELQRGRYTQAAARFTLAHDAAKDVRDRVRVGHALLGLAEVHLVRGRTSEARSAGEGVIESAGGDLLSLELAGRELMARAYLESSNFRRARKEALAGLALCETRADLYRQWLIRLHIDLASIAYEGGDKDAIADELRHARTHLRHLEDRGRAAIGYRRMAAIHSRSNPAEAIRILVEAAGWAVAQGNVKEQALALGELGEVYRRLGRLREAGEAFAIEGRLVAELGFARGRAFNEFHRATVALARGKLDEARKRAQSCHSYAVSAGNHLSRVFALELRGIVDTELGDYGEAAKNFQSGLELAQLLDHGERIANILRARAELRIATGELDGAAEDIETSRLTARVDSRDVVMEFGYLVDEHLDVTEARLALARFDVALADHLLKRPCQAFDELEVPMSAVDAHLVAAEVAAQGGAEDKARAILRVIGDKTAEMGWGLLELKARRLAQTLMPTTR